MTQVETVKAQFEICATIERAFLHDSVKLDMDDLAFVRKCKFYPKPLAEKPLRRLRLIAERIKE